jgi:signal transduction histidine kinase
MTRVLPHAAVLALCTIGLAASRSVTGADVELWARLFEALPPASPAWGDTASRRSTWSPLLTLALCGLVSLWPVWLASNSRLQDSRPRPPDPWMQALVLWLVAVIVGLFMFATWPPLCAPALAWLGSRALWRTHLLRQLANRVDHLLRVNGRKPGQTSRDALRDLESRVDGLIRAQLRIHRTLRALNALPVALVETRSDGSIRWANHAAVRYWSRGDIDTLLKQRLPHWLEQCVPSLMEDLPCCDPSLAAEPFTRFTDADGTEPDLLLLGAPRRRGTGNDRGWVLCLADIRELRREIRARQDALRYLLHDIRAPLSTLLMSVENLRLAPDFAQAASSLHPIEQLARRALRLAESHLQLARVQSTELPREPGSLADVVQDAIDAQWEYAAERGVALRWMQAADDEPIDARFHRESLARAVGNLLNNAVRHSPSGSTVDCSLSRHGEHACIAVIDQGPGIPAALATQLFRRVRADPSAPLHVSGFGLGLTYVRVVAQRHDGWAEVRAAQPHGAEFRILIPLARSPGVSSDF